MRHQKHRHLLGVKKEHREAMVAALATALFNHRRIETTLAKAKALRPFAERLITLAKRASQSEVGAEKLHLRRLAAGRLRNPGALATLFDERASEFLNRSGGYTRIYKLTPRGSDAAPMALIELIPASDEGYKKSRRGKPGKSARKSPKTPKAAKTEPSSPEPETPNETSPGLSTGKPETSSST
jgi:large subunit ribosomal protein L17